MGKTLSNGAGPKIVKGASGPLLEGRNGAVGCAVK